MSKLTRNMSIASRSLRPQLVIAYCLMSVIPVLALLNFIFPSFLPKNYLHVVVAIVILMTGLGFYLLKRIIDPIIQITSEVKVIANGELSRRISVTREDEIGEIGGALNELTKRIESNMDELKVYGERTKSINSQINRQVIALSGLLQISNLITKGADLKDLFETTTSRLTQAASSSLAFVMLKKEDGFDIVAHYGISQDGLIAAGMPVNNYLFSNLLEHQIRLKIDDEAARDASKSLIKVFDVKNLLVYPIIVHGEAVGLLGMGNRLDSFSYTQDDGDLMNIFTKQLSIALENDLLSRKVKDLEIRDPLTNLFNKRYMIGCYDEEILRAISHQQPCSFILVKLQNYHQLKGNLDKAPLADVLLKTAAILRTTVSKIDKVGRIEDDEFCLILPEKNKRYAQELASKIKDKIQSIFIEDNADKRPGFSISVVENPIDGADAHALIEKAKHLIGSKESF
ncbi:MAG: diguanylate cyclase [Candidatus Omnitrophota bacterium]